MPSKYICRPLAIKRRIQDLEFAYGENIMEEVFALYVLCFSSSRSHSYVKLKRVLKNEEGISPIEDLPFLKSGTREDRLVFVPLLFSLLKDKSKFDGKDVPEDATFIIYLIYFTGFNGDLSDLYLAFEETGKIQAFSCSHFQKLFSPVERLKFREPQRKDKMVLRPHVYAVNESVTMTAFKKALHDSNTKFKTKYKNHEKVVKALIKDALDQFYDR